MNRKMRLLFAACLALGLSACGPADISDEPLTSEDPAQVEQEIGTTPLCSTGGYITSKTEYTTCGTCTYPTTQYGLRGSYYERCCYPNGTCGGWKLIKPVCGVCELQ
jgi:hypothetical protein